MFGIFVIKGFSPSGLKALLCMIFVLLTAPTGAHALAKGAYMYGVRLWKKSVKDDYSQVYKQGEETPDVKNDEIP